MTWTDKLKSIEAGFASLPGNVYHRWRPKMQPPFTVWQEQGENGFEADNRKAEQGVTGSVDYFTRADMDPVIDQIQQLMTDLGMAWTLNSIQYEDETNLIHYEWLWEVA